MSTSATQASRPWFEQAASDARTAEALLAMPDPMRAEDVGCHVAAMCAQAIEKCLKGYLLLNGIEPAMDHRPDKYLASLLTRGDPLLRYGSHHSWISKLFDAETKHRIRRLFDLTPGGAGRRTDVVNTEYPWKDSQQWRHAPCGAVALTDHRSLEAWVETATRVRGTLYKLWSAVDRGSG